VSAQPREEEQTPAFFQTKYNRFLETKRGKHPARVWCRSNHLKSRCSRKVWCNPAKRSNYRPAKFTPRQNPFYCALPYNDKQRTGHRPEAAWFKEAYQGPAVSTCKDRWVSIRKDNRVAYAQWEDAGPFRTDHWQYVFGNERPKLNLNKGAGLDVSPAVRDYLTLKPTDLTDWRFVDFTEVPRGPWSTLGENNTFVINDRKKAAKAD
jgi:hypothetical protein